MALAAMALKLWLPILIPPLRTFLAHIFFAENYGIPAHRGLERVALITICRKDITVDILSHLDSSQNL